MQDDYDVLIIGGGLVGASLACALGGQALRVAVAEEVPFDAGEQPGDDDRSIALACGSQRILAAMDLWPAVAPQAMPIHRIHVSDRGHFGVARFDRAEQGVDALGQVVEIRVLGRALHERLETLANVELLCPAQLRELVVEQDAVGVTLLTADGERRLRAALVVAADGANSAVRERLRIPVVRRDYGQSAVIANLSSQNPHRNVAYERFTDSGPLALLPLPGSAADEAAGGRCALVWTVRNDQVERLMALDEADFLARLQERFGNRLGRLLRAGRRTAYPLSLARAGEYVRPRVALIGNAAHTLHPVAGQGFNLGIRDVAALADLLATAAQAGADPGSSSLLQRYVNWRQSDQRSVAALTDGLVRLFSTSLPPVVAARDLGLLAVDLLPPLKRLLVRRAMGLAGRMPRLARGLSLR